MHTVHTYQEGSLFLWRRAWSSCTQTFITWLSATPYGEDYIEGPWSRKPLLQQNECFVNKKSTGLHLLYFTIGILWPGLGINMECVQGTGRTRCCCTTVGDPEEASRSELSMESECSWKKNREEKPNFQLFRKSF